MGRWTRIVLVGMIGLLVACGLLPSASIPVAAVALAVPIFATNAVDATTTATPFQPVEPTATPTITPSPTPRPTPTPEIPNWMRGDLPTPQGIYTVMILGSDSRGGNAFRTDVMILLVVNAEKGKASMVSFPRDLWVTIPGWGENRINTAMEFGGFSMLQATMEYNFGLKPQHYVLTNFDGFFKIVDALEGVKVQVEKPLSDRCDVPGRDSCSVKPGLVDMDGPTALWYVRSRHTTSDMDRTRRQQEMLQGMLRQLLTIRGISKAPEIFNIVSKNVQTDVTWQDALPFISLAPKMLNSDNITRYGIGAGQVYDYIIPGNGAMVLMPYGNAIRQIVQSALQP